jgi:hypothetical protein
MMVQWIPRLTAAAAVHVAGAKGTKVPEVVQASQILPENICEVFHGAG